MIPRQVSACRRGTLNGRRSCLSPGVFATHNSGRTPAHNTSRCSAPNTSAPNHRAHLPVDFVLECGEYTPMEFPVSRLPARAVGARVRELRSALGISQQDLADLAMLHASNLGKLERGEANPNLDTLTRVATALETNVSDLTRYVSADHVSPIDRRVTVSDLIRARHSDESVSAHNAMGHRSSRPSA